MKNDYLFFYDESGHSRKLTKNTILAENYDDYFVSCIIGFEQGQRECIENDYRLFEEKYKRAYGVEELKSTVLKNRKFLYGFNSFTPLDLSFIKDFLTILIKHNVKIYISVQNKIEYLIYQLLQGYENISYIDANALIYCVTKAISVYRPEKVLSSMYEGSIFSNELCSFLEYTISSNKGNELKELENTAFSIAISIIKHNKEIKLLDWDYDVSFIGFSRYLLEQKIHSTCVIIDKEGQGKVVEAAIKRGFVDSFEKDSKEEFGIRISDILSGLINGFLGSIIRETRYENMKPIIKKLLNKKWFEIDINHFECYQMFRTIVIAQNNSWHKTYCSEYCDAFLYLICLLNYISDEGLEKLKQFGNKNGEYLNTYACRSLEERFRINNKDNHYN